MEKELEMHYSQVYLLQKVEELESRLVQEKARQLVQQSALDSAQLRVQDSEMELVRLKEKVKVLELAQE
jgi:hypothetical protein